MTNVLRHLGITVRDINKSLYFYRDLLGLVVSKDLQEQGVHIDNFSCLKNVQLRTIKLKDVNGMILELLEYRSPASESLVDNFDRPINRMGISHFALTVDNIDEIFNKLLSNGISFNYAVQTVPDNDSIRIAFCRDFEGNLIELVEVRE